MFVSWDVCRKVLLYLWTEKLISSLRGIWIPLLNHIYYWKCATQWPIEFSFKAYVQPVLVIVFYEVLIISLSKVKLMKKQHVRVNNAAFNLAFFDSWSASPQFLEKDRKFWSTFYKHTYHNKFYDTGGESWAIAPRIFLYLYMFPLSCSIRSISSFSAALKVTM